MSTRVAMATTLRTLAFDDALAHVDHGAAFVDLRPTAAYLEVHVPGSLALLYESGPGMAGRARDCLPLDLPLILLAVEEADMIGAASALRAKGFTVLGQVENGINAWAARRGPPSSTDVVSTPDPPAGNLLDVGDPGAPRPPDALRIPLEKLWVRVDEVPSAAPVVVIGGYGVRAALAIGILERGGLLDVVLWRGRPAGAR
jgi:rhodanese-related sulfurtransferase